MEKKERWHGANHYTNRVHLFLLSFLFLGALTIYGAYLGMDKIQQKISLKKIPHVSASPAPTLSPTPSITQTPSPTPSPTPKEAVFCTLDAKQCPDGSYVSRRGPKCEFVCPTPTPILR